MEYEKMAVSFTQGDHEVVAKFMGKLLIDDFESTDPKVNIGVTWSAAVRSYGGIAVWAPKEEPTEFSETFMSFDELSGDGLEPDLSRDVEKVTGPDRLGVRADGSRGSIG